MKRREFIAGAGGALVTFARTAHSQQLSGMRRVGLLMPYVESDSEGRARVAAFREEMRKLGWRVGETVRFDERWVAGDLDQLRALAAEIVNLKPDVIITLGGRAVSAALEHTQSIPIVFVGVTDPVGQGIVRSLARPGASITGFAMLEFSVIGKMLEMLKLTAPAMTRACILCNPDNPAATFYKQLLEISALALDVQPSLLRVHNAGDIEGAIQSFAREPSGGLLCPPDVTTFTHRELVIALAARLRLPAAYHDRAMVASGGLLSYGTDRVDHWRRAADYVNRILKGEKPAELPVQQPTKYELLINLKTAKALGLEVPPMLLARADEVIE